MAAKFLTSRFLVMEAMVRTFKQLWRSQNGFKIRNLGNHTVLFEFDNVQHVERILQNQPWTFDKHLMVLKRYKEGSQVKDLIFDKAWFWVQVHDIPLSFMSRMVAESLCDTVGEVRRSLESTEDDGGNFFRVRVNIDISLPLCRGRVITLENGEKSWVRFQYERLPNICYWCGRLDHGNKQCKLWIQSKGSLSTEKQQFGSFLRASPYQRGSRNIFYVLGWFEQETSGKENWEAAAPSAGEAGRPKGDSTMPQPVLVTELGGNTSNSNSLSHFESNTTLGKVKSLGEASVGVNLLLNLHPKNFIEMVSNDSLFLSKLSEIDEGIRKFDSVNNVMGVTSLSKATSPTDYSCPQSLMGNRNPVLPSDPTTIIQKENLAPQVLRDITNIKSSPTHSPLQGKWTRLVRTISTSPSIPEEGFIPGLGKRNQDDSRVLSELPGKRRQVSKGDGPQTKILAEIGHQLRQMQ